MKKLVIFVLIAGWTFTGWPSFGPGSPSLGVRTVEAATNTETFTSGTTWTAPPGVTSVTAECWGGGGGGGGSSGTSGGAGGGGGAYALRAVTVTPGNTYTVTVGAAGSGGSNGASGNPGGDTSFVGDASAQCLAKGGGGGGPNGGAVGAGGSSASSDGTTKYGGGSGATQTAGVGGGGGGSAGTGAIGNNGSGSAGGTAVTGGGPGGAGGAKVSGGSAPASGPGGGGGGSGCRGSNGSCKTSGAQQSGGSGYVGQIKLTYTVYTVLGNGASEPSNAAIAPGGSVTDLDAFSLQDSVGTDTVTAATVTLAPSGASTVIAQVDITDGSNAAVCTAVTNPGSNTVTFSSCSIPVSAAQTAYKVRITPKTHANMPAPNGASYGVTGTVTSVTSTNTQAGSDAGSATVTVDNLSPDAATATSGSAGSQQVTLNWTTSDSADFTRSVVLRWAASTPGTDVPAEGTDYSAGDAIGGATVACVRTTDATSTAVSGTDGGGIGGCGATALTDGQAYSYKIFQKDSGGNYDTGTVVSGSPFTPITATVSVTITSNGTINYGTLAAGAGNDTVTLGTTPVAQNDGSVPEDFNIKGQDTACPWTLSATSGADHYVHEFSANGGTNWTVLTTSYQALATNVAVSGTQNTDLRITAPTSTNCYGTQSVDVTIQAVAH